MTDSLIAQYTDCLSQLRAALDQSVIVRWRKKDGIAQERATPVSHILETQTRHVTGHITEIRKIRQMHNRQ